MRRPFNLEMHCGLLCKQQRIFDDAYLRVLIPNTEVQRAFLGLTWDDYVHRACLGIKRMSFLRTWWTQA